MLAAVAVDVPELISVTKAVAAVLTCTERLEGRTAATRGGMGGGNGPHPVTSAKSKTAPVAPLVLVPAWTQVPVALIAIASMVGGVNPMANGVQLDPPFVVLNTRELEVAA